MNLHNFLLNYTKPNQKIKLLSKNNYDYLKPQEFITSLQLVYDIEKLINKNDNKIADAKILQIESKIINEEQKNIDILIIKLNIE